MEDILQQLVTKRGFRRDDLAWPDHPPTAGVDGWIFEWQEYLLHIPGADRLRVGDGWCNPDRPGSEIFVLKFKNQLGLAEIQPYQGGRPIPGHSTPLCLEVLSGKFPTPAAHQAFFQGLLDELYQQQARLPFTFDASTRQPAAESLRPPTPLFALHFLSACWKEIQTAAGLIFADPHRLLSSQELYLPVGQASQADPDVLLDILRNPQEWVCAPNFPLAQRMQGWAPQRVRQRLPEETFDTPENRFVLDFLQRLLALADSLPSQKWWGSVQNSVKVDRILALRSFLRQAVQHPIFDEVGPLQRLPLESRLLLARPGYRELFELWQRFQQARRPLFGALQSAIDLRDVATLYEFWVFFALVEEIGETLHVEPAIQLKSSDQQGLEWGSVAHFGDQGSLVYNRWFQRNYLHYIFSHAAAYIGPQKGDIADFIQSHSTYRQRLQVLNQQLERSDLHFGYRVFDEIIAYLINADTNGLFAGLGGLEVAFDQAVLMKVLPKFHGSRGRLEKPLLAGLAWCLDLDNPQPAAINQALQKPEEQQIAALEALAYQLPRTAKRVLRLLGRLYTNGFATFG